MWLLPPAAFADELALPHVPDAAIVLDGRADEPAWAQALVLPEATVFTPSDDLPAVGSMRAAVLSDDTELYVHFTVTDPEPALVRAGLGRRDTRFDDDAVGLYLDPTGDGRRAYMLLATPLGVQSDGLHLAGASIFDEDLSWDGVWRSTGHRTPTGFEVEMAIPWATLHISGSAEHLGLVVTRKIGRKGQVYAWPRVVPNTDPVLAAAKVRGPTRLPRRVGLELLPELTGAWSDPHEESGRLELYGVGPGLTVHYAPTTRFGAAGTFNPDFSQLESDATQIDVNQRYALSYEEKRPFFLEGQEWFDHPMDGLVYTRSMNAPLYGVRASGEAGRLGLAALNVLDLSPPPSVNEGGGWTADQLAGHAALASLVRARVGLGGDSYVGLLGSDRTVLDTDLANRMLGVDTSLRLEKRATIDAAALGSATTFGDGAAPTLAPAGQLGALWSGDALYVRGKGLAIAPGFRQENGFVTREDTMGGLVEAHYNLHFAGLPVLSVEPLDVWSYWRFDTTPRERAWDPSVWAQLGDGGFVKLDGRIAGEEFAGSWVDYANTQLYVYETLGSWLRVEAEGTLGTAPYYDPTDPRAGVYQSGWAGVQIQPVSAFTLALEPGLERMTELDGAPLYVAWTGRAKAELFLDRTLWLRAIAETSGSGPDLTAWRVEPVAAWELTPGRAVYLGGTYGVAESPYWQVFAKVGWVFEV